MKNQLIIIFVFTILYSIQSLLFLEISSAKINFTIDFKTEKLSSNDITFETEVDSTSKLDILRSIGADDVIDYTKNNFVMNGKKYDVIIDVVGKRFDTKSLQSLKKGGRLVLGNPRLPGMTKGLCLTNKPNSYLHY